MAVLSSHAQSAGTTTETTKSTTAKPLRVMSYNIRLGTGKDGPDRWAVRKPRLFDVLRRHKPEVIGLQEALIGQVDDLREEFAGYKMLGVGRIDGQTSGEFSALMYDTTRLQALRSDTFWLSETPEVPGSKHWGNKFMRICTWAHFRDLQSNRCFYIFNTHLDHESQPSRVKGTELILRRIKERQPEDPVILTGDLNAGEKNRVNQAIREEGFKDTFRMLHPDVTEVGTTNAFKPERQEAKIDYIYIDEEDWNVTEAEILTDKVDGRWPSDHLPVTATITLKDHSK